MSALTWERVPQDIPPGLLAFWPSGYSTLTDVSVGGCVRLASFIRDVTVREIIDVAIANQGQGFVRMEFWTKIMECQTREQLEAELALRALGKAGDGA